MRFYEHNVVRCTSTCLKFSSCTCEDQFHFFLFCASFFYFFSSDLAHRTPIITSVVVRLFAPDRDSCVLPSCCGLPLVLLQWRILQFSLRVYVKSRRIFSYRLFFFCQACFSSTKANPGFYETNYQVYFYSFAGGLKTKNETKKRQQHVWYVRVIRVHIHMYSMIRIYYDITTTLQQCCCM